MSFLTCLSLSLFPALHFYHCAAGWRHQGAPQRHGGRPENEKVDHEDFFWTVSLEQGAELVVFWLCWGCVFFFCLFVSFVLMYAHMYMWDSHRQRHCVNVVMSDGATLRVRRCLKKLGDHYLQGASYQWTGTLSATGKKILFIFLRAISDGRTQDMLTL